LKLCVFDVESFFAHFRKHFSTTSSISYSFPPRTALIGLVAAILGYERDSYYQKFSSDKCRIALQVRSPVRHITSTMNYLMTDKPLNLKKLRGIEGPMQVHVDILVSGTRKLQPLSFRVFFTHNEENVMNEFVGRMEKGIFAYPPSLGTANDLAQVKFVDLVEAEVCRREGEVEVSTVVPASALCKVYPQYGRRIFVEELVPADFTADRRPSRQETYIYEGEGQAFKVTVNADVFFCTVKGEKVAGVFM